VSRKPRPRLRWAPLVLLVLLIAAGTALAAGARLKVTGPSGTLKADTRYTVTASGNASHNANTLFAYEGGQVGGGTAAIRCNATENGEYAQYKPAPNVHVYLGSHRVHGSFSLTWRFIAAHPGPRSFCAYLTNSSGNTTYAKASLHWTNQPGG